MCFEILIKENNDVWSKTFQAYTYEEAIEELNRIKNKELKNWLPKIKKLSNMLVLKSYNEPLQHILRKTQKIKIFTPLVEKICVYQITLTTIT